MKRSLRVTLLILLVGFTTLTVGVISVVAYLDTRDTATDLTQQILHAKSKRIEFQINDLTNIAHRQIVLNQRLMEIGFLDPDSPANLIDFWENVLNTYHSLNALYLTRADDGTTVIIYKKLKGGLGVQLLLPHGDNRFNLFEATVEEARQGKKGVLLREGSASELDARLEAWFQLARSDNKAVWVDTELNIDDKRPRSMASATHACPLRGPKNREFVLGFDFYLLALCDFVRDVRVSENGLAFILEQQRNGQRRVIAHPDANVVIPPGTNRLVRLAEISDSRIRAFLSQTPAHGGSSPQMLQFQDNGVSYLGAFHSLDHSEGVAPNWVIGMLLPENDVLSRAESNFRHSVVVGGLVILLAIALSLLVARRASRPVEQMARDVAAIGHLDFDSRPQIPSTIFEVDQLQRAIEEMKTSLRSFRKYVPADLVAMLMATGQEAKLGGERKHLTISFSDIADFTTISETMEADKLVDHLGEYLQALSDQILLAGGTVDKYIGDAIMAVWGAPITMPDHALMACTTAVRNQKLLIELRDRWTREGKPPFQSRIGINTGEVVVGNIGSAKRMNYTVVGDEVNLASRLEGLNKHYGTQILISEATYEEAKAGIVVRLLDRVSVKGKNSAVLVYELLGLKGETSPELHELGLKYAEAWNAYHRQDWAEALHGFAAILELWPNDGPSREMKRRCVEYRERPPGADWDGTHRMDNK
ncbi:adenylate/guanylate cyclase domain-containing protein [soil metagenome]